MRVRLSQLRVAQRLALLVLVPLTAVVGLAIPVVLERAALARAAASISDEAYTRRLVGGLLEELQQERLMSLLYLSLPNAEAQPIVRQSQAVNDAVEELRRSGDPYLLPSTARLMELLNVVRPRVITRGILSLVTYKMFSEAAASILDALPPPNARDEGNVPPLAPLDELLRANEQAARAGAAAMVMVTEPLPGKQLFNEATTALSIHTTRFISLAQVEHHQLLVSAEKSDSARRVADLAERASAPNIDVDDVAGRLSAAVETYTTLRRFVGDRIAREIVNDSAEAASRARTTAILVGLLAALLLLFVASAAATGARSIAVPLSHLNNAAIAVAAATERELVRVSDAETDADVTPALRAVPTTGPGDVAALAAAFNQVQAAAAALLARQVSTRRNVSAMFATVARRTRNLADRQLNLVDALERQQLDPQLLKHLYRLDHVATRLRRSASALLVVSGAAEEVPGDPMRVADVVRAAAAEIEQFTRVKLTDVADIAATPGAVPDLILLVAELLDNAVSYSPPPSPVTVSIGLTQVVGVSSVYGCRISIVDTGIGMTEEQIIAENRRLVERERLDVAPTKVLGLFVVGRLARRHGLTVTITDTKPQGITAHIDIPNRLLIEVAGSERRPNPLGIRQMTRREQHEPSVRDRVVDAARMAGGGDFAWFGGSKPVLALPAAIDRAAPSAESVLNRSSAIRAGLVRRVPGNNLPDGATPVPRPLDVTVQLDPMAERVQAEAFTNGFARGAADIALDDDVPDLETPDLEISAAVPGASSAAGPSSSPGTPPQWPLPTTASATSAADGRVPAACVRPLGADGPPGAGLIRRVPGANLAEGLRGPAGWSYPAGQGTPVGRAARHGTGPAGPRQRDPEAERRTLDLFVAGFARGTAAGLSEPDPESAGVLSEPDPDSAAGPSEPESDNASVPDDPRPVYEYTARSPAGSEPQDVERR